ncbi:MAG: hypothetical protein LUC34_02255 [Campylobacter sp.]|nr:hypothetical protein [Campylobacter sp.]
MADEKFNIKDCKGISFKCLTCKTELGFMFETQQVFMHDCPNCGADWLPQPLNIEAIRGLKQALKILSSTQNAQIELVFNNKDKL